MSERKQKDVEAAALAISAILGEMYAEDRADAVSRAFEIGDWCPHCGEANPLHGWCQCQNDE